MKHRGILMLRDELAYCVVEIKRCADRNRHNEDADKPIKN